MSVDCSPGALTDAAKCIETNISPGAQLPVVISLLCTLVNQGGGGGGSGTVTSFSAGNLSPLFTTSVANPTTTPALSFTLSNQNANAFFVGPTGGGAAAPTFRAMVTADLGTTLTPQFARVGLGTAADPTILLFASSGVLGITIPTVYGLTTGVAGDDINVFQFDSTNGDPYMTIGQVAVNNGILFQYQRSVNRFRVGIHGSPVVTIDNTAAIATAGNISSASVISATNGYISNGISGITATFDTGAGNTQIVFNGGIATSIA